MKRDTPRQARVERKTLETDQLMPKIAASMFQLFAQADRCFIVTPDEGD